MYSHPAAMLKWHQAIYDEILITICYGNLTNFHKIISNGLETKLSSSFALATLLFPVFKNVNRVKDFFIEPPAQDLKVGQCLDVMCLFPRVWIYVTCVLILSVHTVA